MHGLWLEDRQLRLREDLPVPVPGPGEALVRVRLAGICATDLELRQGYYLFAGIPGHEFVGEIAAAPDQPGCCGERVVGEINLPCGHCPPCQAGRGNHCERRRVLGIKEHDGAFTEYLVLPLANLHAVPDTIPDEAAVFCEPLAAALRIPEQRPIRAGERVLVVGAGRLGQLIALSLAGGGHELQVVARHPRQRALLEGAGIAWTGEDAVTAGAWDLVIEASGTPAGFELARRALRAAGTLILKSTYASRAEIGLSRLVVDEITLIGSRCGPFVTALERLRLDLDPRPLIDGRYPLAQAVAAFTEAARPGVLKILVTCGDRD
ncbi:MAG: alcohol dehydrogenase catalytic domain-containing protein [Chromatiaceae bacterium]|nr:alcohol dehydrogenase catalytic domain-containing protein [Chromatiaceae bacterium]